MNKLNYHEFYNHIWLSEDFVDIVSDEFIDQESEFIREWTIEVYRQYELRDNVSLQFIKKLFEITFSKLAVFKPKMDRISPVPDGGRNRY